MVDHIEWVSAQERPQGYTAAELTLLSEDGNRAGHIGLRFGGDGAVVYGTKREMVDWLEVAVLEVQRVHNLEIALKRMNAENRIREALSRDDADEFGSLFEDKVQVIRNLNIDSLPDAHDGIPDPLNYEYCRGQVEMLMDTTDWIAELRPEKEDVWLYIFGSEMP